MQKFATEGQVAETLEYIKGMSLEMLEKMLEEIDQSYFSFI